MQKQMLVFSKETMPKYVQNSAKRMASRWGNVAKKSKKKVSDTGNRTRALPAL
jgi:hypothetical protein